MGQLNVKNEELEAMVKEASGPINFTVFLTMFGEKLKGVSATTLHTSSLNLCFFYASYILQKLTVLLFSTQVLIPRTSS